MNNEKKIIAISGQMGSGKDVIAEALKKSLEARGQRVRIVHFGDLVKFSCKLFWDWDGVKDEYGRKLLQKVGTDIVRDKYDRYYWSRYVCNMLEFSKDMWDVAIIPDLRFDNEMLKLGWTFGPGNVKHVRVVGMYKVAEWSDEVKTHKSEHSITGKMVPDAVVYNYKDEIDGEALLKELYGRKEG